MPEDDLLSTSWYDQHFRTSDSGAVLTWDLLNRDMPISASGNLRCETTSSSECHTPSCLQDESWYRMISTSTYPLHSTTPTHHVPLYPLLWRGTRHLARALWPLREGGRRIAYRARVSFVCEIMVRNMIRSTILCPRTLYSLRDSTTAIPTPFVILFIVEQCLTPSHTPFTVRVWDCMKLTTRPTGSTTYFVEA